MENGSKQAMPERQKLVLVVEDNESVRTPLEKFLRLHGFEVMSAITADEALDLIAARPPSAAIVDLRLPQGSGRDVIISLPTSVPVVIFSAVPKDADGLERIRPNTRLILKPFSLTMLVETIKRMLGDADA